MTFLTTTELADRWRTSARAIRSEIKRKRLPATYINGQWLIDQADVEEFEAGRSNVTRTPKRTRRPQARKRVTS